MPRRHLWVELPDRTLSLVFPAAECDLPVLDLLLNKLTERWLQSGFQTQLLLQPATWALVEAIALLLPCADRLELDLEAFQKPENLAAFEHLFLPSLEGKPSQIVELHQFEATPQPEWEEGTPLTISDLPFPTSGDIYADQIASLVYSFQPPNAQQIWNWLDQQTRIKMQQVLAELNKPPEQRLSEYTQSVFEQWKESNQDLFEDEMYGW
jgi:hypothetical protein